MVRLKYYDREYLHIVELMTEHYEDRIKEGEFWWRQLQRIYMTYCDGPSTLIWPVAMEKIWPACHVCL
jgi:hypothetical protein